MVILTIWVKAPVIERPRMTRKGTFNCRCDEKEIWTCTAECTCVMSYFSGGSEYEERSALLLCKSHKERIVARLIKGMRTRGATKAMI